MEKLPDDLATTDVAHTFAKAIISAIPVVSGPASVLFDEIFKKPLDKRREHWLISLAKTVEELLEKVDVLSAEILSTNEAFISLVLEASVVAQRTHQQEKLDALKNAIQNSVLPNAPEEYYQSMFVKLIDEFTPMHVDVLELYR
ncbi:MAG: hypothetical protein HZC51_13625 [Nitrospirae bacterium]|nr:hypothetical protein [Nitrospirota bacterium]